MNDLAPHLSAFLLHYLPNERRCSSHTVQGYTDCFRLLVLYAAERSGVRPCQLKIEHFSVSLITDFLQSLEKQRNNTVSTRNVRLAAIRSFFSYLEYRVPSCLELTMQIRTIPPKRADKPLIDCWKRQRFRRSWMRLQPTRKPDCVIVRCCIFAMPRHYAYPS